MEPAMGTEPAAPDSAVVGPVDERIGGLDIGLLLIRVLPGVVFILHGMQKLFGALGGPGLHGFADYLASMGVPEPLFAATLAAGFEFVGGLSLLSGIGARILAIPLFFDMAVACMLAHRHAFFLNNGGMEYALTLAFIMLGIAILGPGRITIPEAIRVTKRPRA
jgi:putative oxidoreductase